MALIPGTIPATGTFAPTDSTDTFAIMDMIYAADGLRNTANKTERNAISTERRKAGMIVGTQDSGEYWKLSPGPWAFDDTDWSLFLGASGASNLVDLLDVDFTSPIADQDILVYNIGTGQWENKPLVNVDLDSIYTRSGSLSGNRIITDAGFDFTITGTGNYLFDTAGTIDILGDSDITIDAGNILSLKATTNVYVENNNFALQDGPNLGHLVATTLTADRTYTFQDASGTVAFLGDITAATTLSAVLANGNTTLDGQTINALNGGGQLDLRAGSDGVVVLNNDNGLQASAVAYLSDGYSALVIDGWSAAYEVSRSNGSDYVINMYTTHGMISIIDNPLATVVNQNGLHILNSTLVGGTMPVEGIHKINAFLASPNSSVNTGVKNSVALGGKNLKLKTNNTAYVTQIGFTSNASGEAYDLILNNIASTVDRTQTFQDANGTIALLSDIPATRTYVESFVAGTVGLPNIITHNLGTEDLIVNLWYGNKEIKSDTIEIIDSNNIEVTFTGSNPTGVLPDVVKITILGL